MSKFTPGPWSWDRETWWENTPGEMEKTGGLMVFPDAGLDRIDGDMPVIAWIDESCGKGKANADLIAAAPEMYEALRWLLHLAHDVSKAGPDFPITEEEWADAWESAKAALERAERGDGEVD